MMFGWRGYPQEAKAVWGARLLWDEVAAGGPGLVHDRLDFGGEQSEVRKLLLALNAGVGNEMTKTAKALIDEGKMTASSSESFVLYEDDKVKAQASPQGSFGYLYVAAWLKEGVDV
jgi:hypothetical protein